MKSFIISLKEMPVNGDRADVFNAGIAYNQAFIRKLEAWLKEKGIEVELPAPEPLPCVIVKLTSEIAAEIEVEFEEVEAIFPNSEISFHDTCS